MHPLLGRASVHASTIEGGIGLSTYPDRCVVRIERRTFPGEQVADVMRTAGAQFESPYPVVYGYPCPFKGHRVAHLVVRTARGTMTVMLIPHERVRRRTEIVRDGMSGVLLPAGKGSVALLTRDGAVPDALADEIVSRVRY